MKRTTTVANPTVLQVAPPTRAKRLPRERPTAPPLSVPLDAFEAMPAHELAVIEAARSILRARLRCSESTAVESPAAARELVRLQLGGYGREVFAVIFLDAQNRFIAIEEMFRGTLTQTSVWPREVVRAAMRHNAAAVLLAHNHPSGCSEPSRSDEFLTRAIKAALALVDVRVLDHLVVAFDGVTSLAERGLM